MDDFDKKFAKLKIQLEQINWPEVYMFKFIVPSEKVDQVKPLFEEGEVSTRTSAKGNYVSVSIKLVMFSADHVLDRYRSVSHIEGLIAL